MKRFLYVLLIYWIAGLGHSVQGQMNRDEMKLRQAGKAHLFLQTICKFPRAADCLCANDEYIVTHFRVGRGRVVSLCASKILNRQQGHLVYRFGSLNGVEMEYPSDRANSLSRFTINEQIGTHVAGFEEYAWFTNNRYKYVLWARPGTNDLAFGVDIIAPNGRRTTLNGVGRRIGNLMPLADILWEKEYSN